MPRLFGRFAAGPWVGVELKSEHGKNDGSVQVSWLRVSSSSRAWTHCRVTASHPLPTHTHAPPGRPPPICTHTHTHIIHTAGTENAVRVRRPGAGLYSASDSRRIGAVERKTPARNLYAPATSSVDTYI